MYTTRLARPWFRGGAPLVWGPETPSTDLLQYWADILSPSTANPAVLDYRPILRYNGRPNSSPGNPGGQPAGDLRPYQPGRCYLGDGTAAITITGTVTSNEGSTPNNLVGQSGTITVPSGETVYDIITDTGENYKCDEGAGDTCYDSSGNGNHGTITNNYSGFHAEQDEYSFHNEVGYTMGDGATLGPLNTYIPRNEATPSEDVLGNPLQYSDRAQGYSVLKNLPCGNFGPTAAINCGIRDAYNFGTGDFSILASTSTDDVSSQFVVDKRHYTDEYKGWNLLVNSSSTATFGVDSGPEDPINVIGQKIVADGQPHTLVAVRSGDDIILYVDAIEDARDSGALGKDFDYNASMGIGYRVANGVLVHQGQIWNVQIYKRAITPAEVIEYHQTGKIVDSSNLSAHYPMSERGGSVIYDLSPNQNIGFWQNYSTDSIWSASQNKYAYNQLNGFNRRLWFNGVDSYANLGSYPDDSSTMRQFTFVMDLAGSISTRSVVQGYYDTGTPNHCIQLSVNSAPSGAEAKGQIDMLIRYDLSILRAGVNINTGITDGNPHQLAVSIDTLNAQIAIWIDGIPQSITYNNTDVVQAFAWNDIYLGARNLDGIADRVFLGTIWRNRVYKRMFTNQDALDSYNGNYPADDILSSHDLNDINPPALTRIRSYTSTGPDVHDLGSPLPIASTPYWFTGWISGTGVILQQGTNFKLESTGGNLEWTANGTTVSTPLPSTEPFYFMAAADATNVTIQVNAVAPVVSPYTQATANNGTFQIGSTNFTGTVGYLYHGLDAIPPDHYNSGYGYHHLQSPPGNLQGAWMGNETTGTLYDWAGDNHLTVLSGDPDTTTGHRTHMVLDTDTSNPSYLTGGYNWIDHPVPTGDTPEVEPGELFLPSLGDQIDWADSIANLPWAANFSPGNPRGVPWPTDYIYGDTTHGRHLTTNDQFARMSYADGLDRFLHYRQALTGGDLTSAQAYTQNQ